MRYIRLPAPERIGHKPLRTQVGPVQITPRKPGTGNVKLAANSRRNRLKTVVKNINLRVPDRTPKRRYAFAALIATGTASMSSVHSVGPYWLINCAEDGLATWLDAATASCRRC